MLGGRLRVLRRPMRSLIPRREFLKVAWIFFGGSRLLHRPKIQRLVTPIRLQRRRHLNALKRRRIEHQKEQKSEYECVLLSCPFSLPSLLASPPFLSSFSPYHPFPSHPITNTHLPTAPSSPNACPRKKQRPQLSRRRTTKLPPPPLPPPPKPFSGVSVWFYVVVFVLRI